MSLQQLSAEIAFQDSNTVCDNPELIKKGSINLNFRQKVGRELSKTIEELSELFYEKIQNTKNHIIIRQITKINNLLMCYFNINYELPLDKKLPKLQFQTNTINLFMVELKKIPGINLENRLKLRNRLLDLAEIKEFKKLVVKLYDLTYYIDDSNVFETLLLSDNVTDNILARIGFEHNQTVSMLRKLAKSNIGASLNPEMAQILIDHGGLPSGISFAVKKCNLPMILFLLNNGDRLNVIDIDTLIENSLIEDIGFRKIKMCDSFNILKNVIHTLSQDLLNVGITTVISFDFNKYKEQIIKLYLLFKENGGKIQENEIEPLLFNQGHDTIDNLERLNIL